MGISLGIIAIKGDHTANTAEIFDTLGYKDLNDDKPFNSFDSALTQLWNYRESAKMGVIVRAICFNGVWTLIYDPELVDLVDEDIMADLSEKMGSEIYTFLLQSTSSTYLFAKYNGERERFLLSSDGEIGEDFGLPLPEEKGIVDKEGFFEEGMLDLALKLGIDIIPEEGNLSYVVKHLGYNEEMQAKLDAFQKSKVEETHQKNKPWWKFW